VDSPSAGTDCIQIEELEVFGRVGVTEDERSKAQRLTLSISIWPDESFDNLEDDIARAVDYAALCLAARDFVQEKSARLIETLAGNLALHLLKLFPIRTVKIELRKFVLPDTKHVAVVVVRNAAAPN
jgi:dihydroneopterin aldolase